MGDPGYHEVVDPSGSRSSTRPLADMPSDGGFAKRGKTCTRRLPDLK